MSFVRSLFGTKRQRHSSGGSVPHKARSRHATECAEVDAEGFGDRLCESVLHPLDEEAMRLIVVREDERNVIFDSKTIKPVDTLAPVPQAQQADGTAPTPPRKRFSPCGKYELMKPSPDARPLTEMLLGAITTVVGADSFKIHTISETRSIMTSRICLCARTRPAVARISESVSADFDASKENGQCSPDLLSASTSSIIAPPEGFSRIHIGSLNENEEDDKNSLSCRPFSPPYQLSRTRRRLLSYKSDLGHEGTVRWKSRSRLSSCGSSQPDEENSRKIGLGILWHMDEKPFVFAHMALLETEFQKLESRIETALLHPKTFFNTVYKAWKEFIDSVKVLANTPRLKNPVWLTMVDGDEEPVSRPFCDSLASLIREFDTKEAGFFLSNIISAVLMHHMSWVASVAPPVTQYSAAASLSSSRRSLFIGSTMNEESQFTPYNVHLAQYLEVVGSMGTRGRTARTYVLGSKCSSDAICKLLFVLSYFVRCSGIKRKTDVPGICNIPTAAVCTSPHAESPADSPLVTSPACLESPSKMDDEVCSQHSAGSSNGTRVMKACIVDDFDLNSPPFPLLSGFSSPGGQGDVDALPSLGRSLLAGPSKAYSSHFVLCGFCNSSVTLRENFCSHAIRDLQIPTAQGPLEHDPVHDVIVVADVNECKVNIGTPSGFEAMSAPSEAVISMLEQFAELHATGLAPKFLLSHLEDSLAHLLAKSLSLVEMVQSRSSHFVAAPISPERVRRIIDCDVSDLRLILNVAAVYSPGILQAVL